MPMQDGYLSHHGIKGQKWGVRRYQNEDGSLTEEGKKRYSEVTRIGKTGGVIKKGTSLYRVTTTQDEKYSPKDRIFVSTNKFDNAMWEDLFNVYEGEKNYSIRLTAVRDIKVAPQYEIGKAYIEVLKKNRLETKRNTIIARSRTYSEIFDGKNKDISKNEMNGGLNIAMNSPTGKKVSAIIEKKGYTAVADILGRDSANDPLILLKPYKDVKVSEISSSHVTSADDAKNVFNVVAEDVRYNKNYSLAKAK